MTIPLFGPLQPAAGRPVEPFRGHADYYAFRFQDAQMEVFIRRTALQEYIDEARRWAQGSPVEVGFLCLGRRERGLDASMFVHIERIAFVATGERGFVRMPVDRKSALLRGIPQWDVVGWAHTHPNFGIFFSGTDHQNCADFGPHGVNLVVDPIANTIGVAIYTEFQWRGPVSRFAGRSDYVRDPGNTPRDIPAPAPLPTETTPQPVERGPAATPAEPEKAEVVEALPEKRAGSNVLPVALAFLAGAVAMLGAENLVAPESTAAPAAPLFASDGPAGPAPAAQVLAQDPARTASDATPDSATTTPAAAPARDECTPDPGTEQAAKADKPAAVPSGDTPQAPPKAKMPSRRATAAATGKTAENPPPTKPSQAPAASGPKNHEN